MSSRFLWQNLFDSATITASSEASGFPVTKIQHRHFLKAWRSAGLSAEWVKADLGSPQAIKAFIVKYHNLTTAATVHVQANSSDSWSGTLPVDVTVTVTADMVARGVIVVDWASAETYQWWRILITDATIADGYVRIGRIYIGGYFEPSRDFYREYDDNQVTLSEIVKGASGQKFVNVLPKYDTFALIYQGLNSTDFATIQTIKRAVGADMAFFIILDSANLQNETYYVSCSSDDWQIHHVFARNNYNLTLTLEEEAS